MQIQHSEFQDQLVRGIAHRMNNILTLFHGYLGLLLMGGTYHGFSRRCGSSNDLGGSNGFGSVSNHKARMIRRVSQTRLFPANTIE